MKKKFLCLAACALVMFGCGSNDFVEDNDSFSTHVQALALMDSSLVQDLARIYSEASNVIYDWGPCFEDPDVPYAYFPNKQGNQTRTEKELSRYICLGPRGYELNITTADAFNAYYEENIRLDPVIPSGTQWKNGKTSMSKAFPGYMTTEEPYEVFQEKIRMMRSFTYEEALDLYKGIIQYQVSNFPECESEIVDALQAIFSYTVENGIGNDNDRDIKAYTAPGGGGPRRYNGHYIYHGVGLQTFEDIYPEYFLPLNYNVCVEQDGSFNKGQFPAVDRAAECIAKSDFIVDNKNHLTESDYNNAQNVVCDFIDACIPNEGYEKEMSSQKGIYEAHCGLPFDWSNYERTYGELLELMDPRFAELPEFVIMANQGFSRMENFYSMETHYWELRRLAQVTCSNSDELGVLSQYDELRSIYVERTKRDLLLYKKSINYDKNVLQCQKNLEEHQQNLENDPSNPNGLTPEEAEQLEEEYGMKNEDA